MQGLTDGVVRGLCPVAPMHAKCGCSCLDSARSGARVLLCLGLLSLGGALALVDRARLCARELGALSVSERRLAPCL